MFSGTSAKKAAAPSPQTTFQMAFLVCATPGAIFRIDRYHSSDPFSCSRVVVVVVVAAKLTCNFVLMLMMMTKHHLVLVLFFLCSSWSSSSPGFSLSFPALPHEVEQQQKKRWSSIFTHAHILCVCVCVCLGFNYHDALRRLSNALLLFVSREKIQDKAFLSFTPGTVFQPLRVFTF